MAHLLNAFNMLTRNILFVFIIILSLIDEAESRGLRHKGVELRGGGGTVGPAPVAPKYKDPDLTMSVSKI